jgi:hypothetical protein
MSVPVATQFDENVGGQELVPIPLPPNSEEYIQEIADQAFARIIEKEESVEGCGPREATLRTKQEIARMQQEDNDEILAKRLQNE